MSKKTKETTRYLWLTNFKINQENFYYLANQGGWLRWKKEDEDFNSFTTLLIHFFKLKFKSIKQHDGKASAIPAGMIGFMSRYLILGLRVLFLL